MIRKIALSLLLFFCFHFAGMGQKTQTFLKIDSNHAFMDVRFGTHYDQLIKRMGLKKEQVNQPGQYMITSKKYLKFYDYRIRYGFAFFSKDNLHSVRVLIDSTFGKAKFPDVLAYFTERYGKPESVNGAYVWYGKNMIVSLQNVQNNAMMDFQSNIIEFPGTQAK